MSYEVGDLVVYEGSDSVCRISDIAELDFQGMSGNRLYYVLNPLYQECVIYNPVDNTNALMRPVITKEEAEKLIDTMPDIDTAGIVVSGTGFQEGKQLAQHYETVIKTRDCAELMKLTMTIYEKKQNCAKNDRSIGTLDNTTMKRAKDMLFGELSVALDIPLDMIQTYIDDRIGGKMSEKSGEAEAESASNG